MTNAPAIQPPKLQYNSFIAIHLPSLPHAAIQWCIAIHPQAIQALLLQYNFNSLANLQYTSYCNTKPSQPALPKPLSHNTILLSQYNWAVAQISACTNFFFVLHFFFFTFPATGKYKKKYIYIYPFFSHFPEHSNKFIKNYFIQFSSVLHPIKP